MVCDNCDKDIDVRIVENHIALCGHCRYNLKKPKPLPKQSKLNRQPVAEVVFFRYKDIYKNFNCCFYCGEAIPFSSITIDHYRPKSKGGKRENNRVFACVYCNGLKGNLSIDEFRNRLMMRLKKQHDERTKNKIRSSINTCSLILNDLIKPPLF